ncbi:hypothetical protein SPHINGOR109_50265 [Sphingorhabdus sp. 109]|nr:hypothetical protein SPHINGOR109_50265 [Sphingorhabdus sp. 109]
MIIVTKAGSFFIALSLREAYPLCNGESPDMKRSVAGSHRIAKNRLKPVDSASPIG